MITWHFGMHATSLFFFFWKAFVGPRSTLFCHWYLLFWTSDDSVHEFQSPGGLTVARVLLLLEHNHPWIEPGSFTPKASMIPLRLLDPSHNLILSYIIFINYLLLILIGITTKHSVGTQYYCYWRIIYRLGARYSTKLFHTKANQDIN